MKRFLFLLAVMLPVLAMAESMYKWVDENGVVHFSETPPNEMPDAEVVQQNSPQRISNEPPVNDASDESDNGQVKASGSGVSISTPEEKASYCRSLKSNLAMLETSPRLQLTQPNGEQEILTDESRDREKARINRLLDLFCGE